MILERIEAAVDRAVRRRTFQEPLAAAFSFSCYAEAEDGGEGQVFDRALRRNTDPRIARLIERHRADEIRHAALLRARRAALGLAPVPVPKHLQLVDRLSEEAGGILDLPMTTDTDLGRVYALLFVVEERAAYEFGAAVAALRANGDLETAALFEGIGDDERRHLEYCVAIGVRYLGHEAFEGEVERLRAIEARVNGEVTRAFAWWLLKHEALRLPALVSMGFAVILGLLEAQGRPTRALSGPVRRHHGALAAA